MSKADHALITSTKVTPTRHDAPCTGRAAPANNVTGTNALPPLPEDIPPSRELTRRVLLGGASLAAASLAAASLPEAALAGNPWAPTELGLELMRRLPAFAEATYVRVNMVDAEWSPDYDAEKVAAADEAENETEALVDEIVDAILARPVTELSHLTDLALVEALDDVHRDEFGRRDKATTALVEAILRLGGVPQSASSMDAVYKQIERAQATA